MVIRYIFTYFTLLFFFLLTGFTAGCAQNRPLAYKQPLYAQDKLQSADHWDNIANTVAMRIQKSLEERRDLIHKPLYVLPPNEKPFATAFSNLLRTRLVSKGMQVSDKREANSVEIRYDVQTILHDNSLDWRPSLAAMGIGIANIVTGKYPSRSDHEIIVNTSMVHKNRFVMHLSTICYIDDNEWPMYVNAAGYGKSSGSSAGGNADATWQRYAARGQAFADCPPVAVAYTAPQDDAPVKTPARKKSVRRTSKPRAAPKISADPLFPDPLCPDGCIPAPRPISSGTYQRVMPPQTSERSIASPGISAPAAPSLLPSATAPPAALTPDVIPPVPEGVTTILPQPPQPAPASGS